MATNFREKRVNTGLSRWELNRDFRISEEDWQKTVIDLLHLHGFKVSEVRRARTMRGGLEVYRTPWGSDGMGFPDLIAINREKKILIVIENKSMKGQTSPEQEEWLLYWSSVCDNVFVLRPDDFDVFKEKLEGMIRGL
jgi:hypothetical protein